MTTVEYLFRLGNLFLEVDTSRTVLKREFFLRLGSRKDPWIFFNSFELKSYFFDLFFLLSSMVLVTGELLEACFRAYLDFIVKYPSVPWLYIFLLFFLNLWRYKFKGIWTFWFYFWVEVYVYPQIIPMVIYLKFVTYLKCIENYYKSSDLFLGHSTFQILLSPFIA